MITVLNVFPTMHGDEEERGKPQGGVGIEQVRRREKLERGCAGVDVQQLSVSFVLPGLICLSRHASIFSIFPT